MYLKDIIRGVKDMIKIDLITGFLGAGKTTFIKKYASYLMKQGKKIGILENDFGAINVDMLLLQDLEGDNCTLEMIAGGCDADCHRRRFKRSTSDRSGPYFCGFASGRSHQTGHCHIIYGLYGSRGC